MADVQIENGYVKIANELLDFLCSQHLTIGEYKIIMCVIRKTYGYNKKEDAISITQFQKYCKMSHQTVCNCLKRLVKMQALIKVKSKPICIWKLQKDYELWLVKNKALVKIEALEGSQKRHKKVVKIEALTKDIYTKDNKYKDSTLTKFNELWDKYPSKIGRKMAFRQFNATIKTDQDWQNINIALTNYLQSDRVKKGYIQNGSTWLNNWQDWIEKPIAKTKVYYE